MSRDNLSEEENDEESMEQEEEEEPAPFLRPVTRDSVQDS